jgi:HD-GYP domain-containing protein (c-di-GMP phosphodiesterase class II)
MSGGGSGARHGPREPRQVSEQAGVERLIAQLAGTLTTYGLYPATHPAVAAALAQLRDGVAAACDERRQVALTFIRLDDELVVESRPLRSRAIFLQPFIRALRRSDVARLTLARDVDLDECCALVVALATGRRPESTAHVQVGQIEIAGVDAAQGSEAGTVGSLMDAQVEMARDLFCRIRHEGVVGFDPIEELVWGLADAVARSTQAVLPTVPLKSHDEYTFVHSVNVSLLVLAQARSFGFEGALLHTIGVAALLHDVGKLRVPLDVLNKAGKLSGDEWQTMASHAELGAWELAALATSTPLAILVAYEHHLRYDGEPNYPAVHGTRVPTLASQLTAIADVYDAICTVRPYRRALSQAVALDVLRFRAGTFHDPYLVGQFCQLVAAE